MAKTPRADRYIRLGGPIPRIYPGTLAQLKQLLSDAQHASRFTPGYHYAIAVYGRERVTLRIYEAGACTWEPGIPDSATELHHHTAPQRKGSG